jgi:sugar lactone lactonase YvrE
MSSARSSAAATRSLVCLAAVVGITAAWPLSAQARASAGPRAAIVSIPLPSPGDVSYGMAQVQVVRGASRRATGSVFTGRVGGIAIAARAAKWSSLRQSTRVYVAVSRVATGTSALRNVAFVVTRRLGGSPTRGAVTFTIAGARPEVGSFWVKKADRSGHARIFTVRDYVATAISNWSRYMAALKVANALTAALRVHHAAPAVSGASSSAISVGGDRMSPLAHRVFALIFGTLRDPSAFAAAKRNPVASEFIATELRNPGLAQRWSDVVAQLPPVVPDRYAAAAQEEAKFTRVVAPRISAREVSVSDPANSSQTAGRQMPVYNGPPYERLVAGKVGSGLVTSKDRAIYCGQFCASHYFDGDSSQLVATADPGSRFAGWQGCPRPSGDTCTVDFHITSADLGKAVNVTATFMTGSTPLPTSYGLSVFTAGAGVGTVVSNPPGIGCKTPCSSNSTAQFPAGQPVTLTATAAPGSSFSGWSGCDTSAANTCTVTMSLAKSVTATFAPAGSSATYRLTVITPGAGSGHVASAPAGIDCTTPCSSGQSALFAAGQQVTLTASPAAGSVLGGWTGCSSSSGNSCTVNLTADKTIAAAFAPPALTKTTYAYSNLVGSFGAATNPYAGGPEGVSVAGGNVWVAETSNNRVDEFTPTGSSPTLTFGGFDTPRQAAADPVRGLVDVSDTYHGRVAQFTSSGTYVKDFPAGVVTPRGVAIDPGSGTVAVADVTRSEIDEFGADTTALRRIGPAGTSYTTFNQPEGVAFDAAGHVWVADTQANKVEEFDSAGAIVTSWTVPATGELSKPTGIAVDPNGHVFLASWSTSRLVEYSGSGSYIATIASFGSGTGQVSGPVTVAVDDTNGDLYVADEGNNRVQRFTLVS